MQSYLINRLLIAIPTTIGITILIFLAMRVLPGDPLAIVRQDATNSVHVLTEEELQKARESLGLNDPYHVQYLRWMGDVARGDFGVSFWRGEPISEMILRRGPISGQIAIMAILISWIVGAPIGMLSAMRRNSLPDYLSRFFATLFMAIPSFWIGMVVVLVGVLVFTWRPPLTISYLWSDPSRNLQMTIGPAVAMGLGLAAVIARVTRSSVLEVLGQDYVRTAHAKGLRNHIILMRHVFKNAMLPIVTLSGLSLGGLLGGSVAVERAFGVPGLGMALVLAITERDWVMIQNLVLLYGVIFTIINVLVDVSYGWFDPRIHFK